MFQRFPSGYAKLAMSWLGVLAILFIPFRPFNSEPVLAGLMPVAKRFGVSAAFIFAFASIVVHDAFTSGIGSWTWITASVYGLIGIGASGHFRHHTATPLHFLTFGLASTLLFDALTGLTVGPLFCHQPFMAAFIGQIPFTLMHLAVTAVFSVTLSPLLWRWFTPDASLESTSALVRSRT